MATDLTFVKQAISDKYDGDGLHGFCLRGNVGAEVLHKADNDIEVVSWLLFLNFTNPTMEILSKSGLSRSTIQTSLDIMMRHTRQWSFEHLTLIKAFQRINNLIITGDVKTQDDTHALLVLHAIPKIEILGKLQCSNLQFLDPLNPNQHRNAEDLTTFLLAAASLAARSNEIGATIGIITDIFMSFLRTKVPEQVRKTMTSFAEKQMDAQSHGVYSYLKTLLNAVNNVQNPKLKSILITGITVSMAGGYVIYTHQQEQSCRQRVRDLMQDLDAQANAWQEKYNEQSKILNDNKERDKRELEMKKQIESLIRNKSHAFINIIQDHQRRLKV